MVFLLRWLLLAFAFTVVGGQVFAASSRENRAYAAAVGAFQDGMWSRAEAEFARFADMFPASSRVPEAVLLRARAEYQQGKLPDAIARLTSADNLARAGTLADEYFYWAGEAQFQGTNYSAAAQTWVALTQKFPESRLRLRAVVAAAAAFTRLAEWRETVALLQATNGVFLRAVPLDPGNELVARGELLLAQARFELKDFPGAAAILKPLLDSPALKPELGWQGARLLYQVKLAAGEAGAALAATTNLLELARLEKNDGWQAEGTALRAGALEKLGRSAEALAAYQENLAQVVVARQREAVLKIAELAIAQNQFPVATNALAKFLTRFPDSPSADIALLTLGELNLKDCVAQPAATNRLSAVREPFDRFISTFTNSPLLGRAYLGRGWCFWLAEQYPESFEEFKTAAQKIAALQLPPSEDLLVAWFKMGDALLAQKNYAGALENYRAVLDSLKLFPEAGAPLGGRALYQSLRASLELKDMAGATNALAQLLEQLPAGELAQGGALLLAESQTDLTRSANARALLEKFEAAFPDSPLRSQVELAVARSYEQEPNWPAAVTNYASWLKNFPASPLQPQVIYALARADFQAGNETNAFVQFTNFAGLYPTNPLAPLAQWWVADHFFRAGDYVSAERNYKSVFEKWPAADLAWPARMMAGRAAVARLDYNGAIRDYFTKLEPDTNCPIDLRVQATFAHGAALMLSESADTNQPLANFELATNLFSQICRLYPTNELGALAWGEIGNCALQLSALDAATNAYAQVFNSPFASLSARSQARIGFGIALEKQAAQTAGTNQTALFQLALQNYRDVFDTSLDDGADSFWVKKAGLSAASLAETLADYEVALKIYERLAVYFPQLQASLGKKIAAAKAHLPPGKN